MPNKAAAALHDPPLPMDYNDSLSGWEAAEPIQLCQKLLASLADEAGCQY